MADSHPARRLRELVSARLGLAPSALRDARVELALERLTAAAVTPGPHTALERLASLPLDSAPWQQVMGVLLVGETCFFRQAGWFSQLEEHVIAPLIARRMAVGPKRLRLWSAACSTGEEAYTLALIVERLLGGQPDWDITIVGSDLNANALEAARRAIYRASALREVEPDLRKRHFRMLDANRFELAEAVRRRVAFRTLNLIEPDWPDEPELRDFDLIVCRNVLMYLTPEHQRSVARRLGARLGAGGWLAVAPAEAVAEWFAPLVALNVPSAIFFQRPSLALSTPPAPAVPRSAPAPTTDDPARIRLMERLRTAAGENSQ